MQTIIQEIPGYTLLSKFVVNIVENDVDDFVISVQGANINTSGDTVEEAIHNITSLVADYAEKIMPMPDAKLGPGLIAVKRWLLKYIKSKPEEVV